MDKLAHDEVSMRFHGNIPPKYLDGYYTREKFNRETDQWDWKFHRVRKAADDDLVLYAAVLVAEAEPA